MRHQPHEAVQDRLHPQRQRLLDDEAADRRVALDRLLRQGAAQPFEVAHVPPRGGGLVGQEGGDARLGAAQLAERQLPDLLQARLDQEAAHAEERQAVELLPPRRLVPIGHGVGERAVIVGHAFREGRLEGQRPRRRRPRTLQAVPAPRPVRTGHLAQVKPQARRRQARPRRGDRHPVRPIARDADGPQFRIHPEAHPPLQPRRHAPGQLIQRPRRGHHRRQPRQHHQQFAHDTAHFRTIVFIIRQSRRFGDSFRGRRDGAARRDAPPASTCLRGSFRGSRRSGLGRRLYVRVFTEYPRLQHLLQLRFPGKILPAQIQLHNVIKPPVFIS